MNSQPKALGRPHLSKSQLSYRIDLIKKRIRTFPLDQLDFIMMDLERPDCASRMADWCTGDLTGRILEFLSCVQILNGTEDCGLTDLFSRILRTQSPCGLFGRFADVPGRKPHEEEAVSGCNKLFHGMVRYYESTGDYRALDAAKGIADYLIKHSGAWLEMGSADKPVPIYFWVVEPFARLYGITGDERYINIIKKIKYHIGTLEGSHSHGLLSILRGFQVAAMITGDESFNELPEKYRRIIIDRKYELPDGDICEYFPRSHRNEGCSISDWMMMNLNAGYLSGDDDAYDRAEHILWNALFFNQIVTGGLGHRSMAPEGYGTREFQEAWWCCTMNGGMAMTEYARHAVIRRGQEVRVNLLVPGDYSVSVPGGEVKVRITTAWPYKAEVIVTAKGLPDDMSLLLRIPSCITEAESEQNRRGDTVTLRMSGCIGYKLVQWFSDRTEDETVTGKYLLTYGPLILAPSCYTWERAYTGDAKNSTVPKGYIPAQFPTMDCNIVAPPPMANGYRAFSHNPMPDWSYYEEGSQARFSVGDVSANVTLAFPDGSRHTVYFWPMCYNTSTLCLYDTPILFGLVKDQSI